MTQQLSTKTEEQSWLKLKIAQLRYIFYTDKAPIIVSILFIVGLIFDASTGWEYTHCFKELWNKELDQVATLATLIVALFVWYGEISAEWKLSLPKRLTVEFKNSQGERVMLCVNAHLSDEADIRPLGQTIGGQLAPETRLDFRAPFVQQTSGKILHDAEIGYYLHYHASFILTNLPESLKTLPPGKHKCWLPPFRMEDIHECDN